METIIGIQLTPLKGGATSEVAELHFGQTGLFGDREFMLVETETHINQRHQKGYVARPGHFLSMREDPVLIQVVPTYEEERVVFRLRGTEEMLSIQRDAERRPTPVSVWGWQGYSNKRGR